MIQHVFVLQGWLTTKAVDDVEVQLKEKLGRRRICLPTTQDC